MNDTTAVTGSAEQCPKRDPFGDQCKNKRICTISYAEKSNPDGEVWLDKTCIVHAKGYINVLVGKYDLAWVKMDFGF